MGANLTAFYRHIDGEQRAKEQLPTFLEKHVSKFLLVLFIIILNYTTKTLLFFTNCTKSSEEIWGVY